MNDDDRVVLLIAILLDDLARVDERDDAAMYLGDYDDERALNALIAVATNPKSEKFIMNACGESIAEIMIRKNIIDNGVIARLCGVAQLEAISYIRAKRPDWEFD